MMSSLRNVFFNLSDLIFGCLPKETALETCVAKAKYCHHMAITYVPGYSPEQNLVFANTWRDMAHAWVHDGQRYRAQRQGGSPE